jgi:hypothetical protein
VKPTRSYLWLLALACAGCLTGRGTQDDKPPAAELVEPPPRVQPEEVNATNLRPSLRKLTAELDFDERALQPELRDKATR